MLKSIRPIIVFPFVRQLLNYRPTIVEFSSDGKILVSLKTVFTY